MQIEGVTRASTGTFDFGLWRAECESALFERLLLFWGPRTAPSVPTALIIDFLASPPDDTEVNIAINRALAESSAGEQRA
jgi:hypothetical protein